MMTTELNFEDPKVLTALEFSVESKIDLNSDEAVTIIAHPETVKQIKIAIAKGLVFSEIYSRLQFNQDECMKESELLIIPDSVIEDIIRDDIQNELKHNEEIIEKMKNLNEKLGSISEERLIRISSTKEEELTAEELELKNEIQFTMLDVGMNIDLQFSSPEAKEAKIDSLINKMQDTDKVVRVDFATLTNKGEENE